MSTPYFVDWSGLVYYDEKNKKYINNKIAQCTHFGGACLFNDLPVPSLSNLNYQYKVTDSFVPSSDFNTQETLCPKNTLIQCVETDGMYRYVIISNGAPQLDDYTTDSELQSAITKLSNSTQDLISSLRNTKQDAVPFKTKHIVGNGIGGIKTGDNVQNWTVKELFMKLLDIVPDNQTIEDVIDEIVTDRQPCIVSVDGITDVVTEWQELSGETAEYDETGFYMILDKDDNIASAGYQIAFNVDGTFANAQKFYLPSTATIKKAYSYLNDTWAASEFPGDYWICSGSKIFTINGLDYDYAEYTYNVENVGDVMTAPEYWRFEIGV